MKYAHLKSLPFQTFKLSNFSYPNQLFKLAEFFKGLALGQTQNTSSKEKEKTERVKVKDKEGKNVESP